jgi:hypothetical protein
VGIFLVVVITAAVCALVFLTIFSLCYHRGLFIRTVYASEPPAPVVVQGEVIEEPTPFFDEHDLAVMEARTERPEFVHTEILLNGIPAGPDGTVPPDKETSWWRR